jgi:hypothetical protein
MGHPGQLGCQTIGFGIFCFVFQAEVQSFPLISPGNGFCHVPLKHILEVEKC